MPNANWSNPTLTSTYTNFVTEVKNRDEDLALQFDGTTSTNIPTNTIRWDSSANRWKKWNGSSWVELTGTYALTALTTTGSVGIGTTTPRGLVSIANNAAGTGVVDSSLHFGYSISDYYGHRIVNSNEPTSTAAGLLKFQRGTTAAWANSVVIDDSGSVGIGTSSPATLLHVSGASSTAATLETSSTDVYLRFQNSVNTGGYIGYNSSALTFWTADAERLRIGSSGQLGLSGANYGTAGQVLTSAGASAAPTWARPSAITAGTSVASTSGTSIDFTSIPSWVKRVTVMFDGVGTSSTSLKLLQLGDSGGIETTGYASSAGTDASRFATSTSGFVLSHAFNSSNAETMFGAIVLTNVASNTWVAQGTFHMPTYTVGNYVAGGKALSGTLDRVRITTVNGTDTFDAGSINILWEG